MKSTNKNFYSTKSGVNATKNDPKANKLIESIKINTNRQSKPTSSKKPSPMPLISRNGSIENEARTNRQRMVIESAKVKKTSNTPVITIPSQRGEPNDLRSTVKVVSTGFHLKNISELTKGSLFSNAPNSDRSHYKKTLASSLKPVSNGNLTKKIIK